MPYEIDLAFQQLSKMVRLPSLRIGLLLCLSVGNSFVLRVDLSRRLATKIWSAPEPLAVVAVTREDGKNGKLIRQINEDKDLRNRVKILEMPCIAHASGPDYDSLSDTLSSKKWNYVAVTSPEAAKVVASAWGVVRDNPIPVVAVGKATEKTLEGFGIPVSFVPSKATAATLARELELQGDDTTLLYPASAKAKDTLQDGLKARGFEVTRLNTYDTVTAEWSEEEKEMAKTVQIACFASPSSVKGWLYNTDSNKSVKAACIGETSATACLGHEWREDEVFFPESPGLEGWVDSIKEAIKSLQD